MRVRQYAYRVHQAKALSRLTTLRSDPVDGT